MAGNRFGRRIPRFVVFLGLFLATAAIAIIVIAPTGGAPAPGARVSQGWVQTRWGPLGPADRDLLVRVRLAGLWEIPVSQQAQQRAGSSRVKDVAMHLMTTHTTLDEQVRSVAAELGVDLPSQPNADQKGWMGQLSDKMGSDYDRAYANLLRQAHGKVFSVVAGVRSGTRNERVRAFAQQAINVVMTHITLLESTGLVDFAALAA
ncbi:DUF4142 domain-containing protein [Streptosporangium subroseum]|uniref:DUF4142 domain-containing protein n=1 Tax=Streptosporangium subroseum TaxID=106412 RepID=UPI00308E8E74|nr:DUF4142 domain-containing protein [Streptosporangium subroseum]